jgi:hypothetical protein
VPGFFFPESKHGTSVPLCSLVWSHSLVFFHSFNVIHVLIQLRRFKHDVFTIKESNELISLGTWYHPSEVPLWPTIAPVPEKFVEACQPFLPSSGTIRVLFEYVFEDHVPRRRLKPHKFLVPFVRWFAHEDSANGCLLHFLMVPDLRRYLAVSKTTNQLGSFGWRFERRRLKQAGYDYTPDELTYEAIIKDEQRWRMRVQFPWHESWLNPDGSRSAGDTSFACRVSDSALVCRFHLDHFWPPGRAACSKCGVLPRKRWQMICVTCSGFSRERS